MSITLKFLKAKKSLSLQVFPDASFANNEHHLSQLRYFILFNDRYNRCQRLLYTSYKAKRVNRTVLESKATAFLNGYDMAYVIKYDVQLINGCYIIHSMPTDSLLLFDIHTKASTTTENV